MTTYDEEELKKLANATPKTLPWYVTVLYGDYGSGKTTIASSMVKERGLLISSDDSWKVLLKPSNHELYSKFGDGEHIKGYEGLSQFKYLGLEGFDTIIWDTLSQSVDMYLDLLYDEGKWSGNNREKLMSKNTELKDVETLGFVDYRVTRDKFRPVLNRLFLNTDAHIIFTSQMKEPIKGMSKGDYANKTRPTIPQATFSIVGTRADVIGMCRDEGGRFVVDVSQNLTQLGKTRLEGIQGKMPASTFVKKYKEIVFS